MATREEFIQRCRSIPAEELRAIMHHDMAGKDVPLDEFYEHAISHVQCEERICRKLKLLTESSRQAKATLEAARYAKLAFYAAVVSIALTLIAIFR